MRMRMIASIKVSLVRQLIAGKIGTLCPPVAIIAFCLTHLQYNSFPFF